MIKERLITEEWVWRAIDFPDRCESGADGNQHYMRIIEEYGNRWLHVVVNQFTNPPRVVTVFFDRRLGRKS